MMGYRLAITMLFLAAAGSGGCGQKGPLTLGAPPPAGSAAPGEQPAEPEEESPSEP